MKNIVSYLTKPLVLFYVVFFYIIAFSIWWSILLFQKNRIAFEEKVELSAISHNMTLSEFKKSSNYTVLYEKFSRQRIMIITEGITFLVLIIIGLYMVRKSFKRELDLASQQRNFLLSITHELKSPLAGIKLSMQTLNKHTLEKEKQDTLVGNTLKDAERLEALVENILLAAKFDNPNYGFATEEVSVSGIIKTVLKQLKVNYPRHEVISKQDLDERVNIQGDKLALSSVFINLVENAFKYSQEAKNPQVTIDLQETANHIKFEITDNGRGVSLNEKDKIFEKFYRIGNENTRSTKGTGLGLFIVRRVIEMYGGHIEVADNEPNGSVFKVTLPKKHPKMPLNIELSTS